MLSPLLLPFDGLHALGPASFVDGELGLSGHPLALTLWLNCSSCSGFPALSGRPAFFHFIVVDMHMDVHSITSITLKVIRP